MTQDPPGQSGRSKRGLPPAAEARIAEIRGSGTWGSALSADAFAAIRSVGFEPVGQVLGAAVYNVGYTGGYGCPGAWAGYGGFAVPYRSVTQVSGQGGYGSFGALVKTMYEARRTAIGRMSAECAALGGHGVVGASQGGYAAMALACFHPDRFGFAGSLSGFLYPSNTTTNGAILAGLQQFGGVDGNGMWGAPQLGRWKWHDPDVHAMMLAQNNSRIWVWSPMNMGGDAAAMIGQAGEAMGNARFFYQEYRNVGGHNGHFDFPGGGNNDWGSWSSQLGAMSGDIVGAIR